MTYPNLGDHDYSISKTIGPKNIEVQAAHETELKTGEITATNAGLEVQLNERDLCPEDSLYIDVRTRNWTLVETSSTPMDPMSDAVTLPLWLAMDVAAIYGVYRWAEENDPGQIDLILTSGAALLALDAVGIGLYAGTSRRKNKRTETQTVTCGDWKGATPMTQAEVSVLDRKLPVAFNPERSVLEVPAAVFGAVLLQRNADESGVLANLSVTRWQETPGLPGSLSTQLTVSNDILKERATPWRCAALEQDFGPEIMQSLSPKQLGDTIQDLRQTCPDAIAPHQITLCDWASEDLKKGVEGLSKVPVRTPADIGAYITGCGDKDRWSTTVHEHLSAQANQKTDRQTVSKNIRAKGQKGRNTDMLTERFSTIDAFEESTTGWSETLGANFTETLTNTLHDLRMQILQQELFPLTARGYGKTWAAERAQKNLDTIHLQAWLTEAETAQLITQTQQQLNKNLLTTAHAFVSAGNATPISYKEPDKPALTEALKPFATLWGPEWVKATKADVYREGFEIIYSQFTQDLQSDLESHREKRCCFFLLDTVEECNQKAPLGLVKSLRYDISSSWYSKAHSKVKKSHKACLQSVGKVERVRAANEREEAASSRSSSGGGSCRPQTQWRKNGNQALTDIIRTNVGGIVLWCQDSRGKRCVQSKMGRSNFKTGALYGVAKTCCCKVMSMP
jgi:hypothetical protein